MLPRVQKSQTAIGTVLGFQFYFESRSINSSKDVRWSRDVYRCFCFLNTLLGLIDRQSRSTKKNKKIVKCDRKQGNFKDMKYVVEEFRLLTVWWMLLFMFRLIWHGTGKGMWWCIPQAGFRTETSRNSVWGWCCLIRWDAPQRAQKVNEIRDRSRCFCDIKQLIWDTVRTEQRVLSFVWSITNLLSCTVICTSTLRSDLWWACGQITWGTPLQLCYSLHGLPPNQNIDDRRIWSSNMSQMLLVRIYSTNRDSQYFVCKHDLYMDANVYFSCRRFRLVFSCVVKSRRQSSAYC